MSVRCGEMPNLRLKQRVLDVQKAFRRRSSTSAHQALAFEERAPSPLAASSESSNAAEKASRMSSSEQVCNNHKEEPASNPLPENTAATALQKETLTRARSASSRNSSLGSTARSPTSPSSPSQPTTSLPLPYEVPLASTKLEGRPRSLKNAAEISGSDPPIDPPPPPPTIIPALTSGKTSSTASVPPDPANAQQLPSKGALRPALPDLPPHSPPAPPRIQTSYPRQRPAQGRKQSLVAPTETALIRTLLGPSTDNNTAASPTFNTNSPLLEESSPTFRSVPIEFQLPTPATLGSSMLNVRVWVKRPGGSPTIVNVRQDDMVDDARDVVLKKYQNALGKSYDAPDISIRVVPRHARPRSLDHPPGRGYDPQLNERTLNPDETITRVLDDYFPGGQSIDEALVIEVPPLPSVVRRTPRPSPHHGSGSHHDGHSGIESNDYFSPMPHTGYPQAPPTSSSQIREPSIAVLATGQVPNLPGSPGGANRRNVRPGTRRMQTSSPVVRPSPSEMGSVTPGVILMPRQNRSRVNSDASNTAQPVQAPPITAPTVEDNTQKASTPPARVASPLAKKLKEKKQHTSPAGLLPDGAVPPINVLIVEDNSINLQLLEAFMKRLKVRWQSAMNGKEAVDKWRAGGFHLVLMDIQLPVMNGLDATKEIRRLERVNSIGAFSQSPSSPSREDAPTIPDPDEKDKLPNSILFKSPVIIVALTASSLQSDRHEALAAGCNDFLTKVCSFLEFTIPFSHTRNEHSYINNYDYRHSLSTSSG